MTYKRILAYLIDIMIVSFLVSFFTYFMPISDKYQEAYEDLQELMGNLEQEDLEDEKYLQQMNDLSYIMTSETVSITIVMSVISLGYYVIFAYYNNGQTIGKKLMKIKITKATNKKLTMNSYLIRALLADSILINIVNIIAILFLKKAVYFQVYEITTFISGLVFVSIFSMILFRQDGRGFHDFLAGTKVVTAVEESFIEPIPLDTDTKEDIKEAEIEDSKILEEKKIETKPTKEKKSAKEKKNKTEKEEKGKKTKKSSK